METILKDMAFANNGVNAEHGDLLLKTANQLRQSYDAPAIRRIAAIVKVAFEDLKLTDDIAYHIYNGLYNNPSVDAESLKLASIGYKCLGRAYQGQEKQANPGAGAAAAGGVARKILPGASSGLVMEAIKAFGTLGALAGVPAGGAAWLFNRGLTGQDKKLREMEIQRDTYGRLAAEVKAELKRRNLDPTPENVAATVDYLT